jgi:hypothetical protein
MKRLIIALLVGGMVFGTVLAAAAVLDVTGTHTIQAGGVTDLVCDEDGVVIDTIGFEWSDDANAYVVTGVIITGIDAACDGGTIAVTLTNNSGDEIETMFLGGIGTSATLTPTGTIPVQNLGDIHILITT